MAQAVSPETSVEAIARSALTWVVVSAKGTAGLPVLFPMMEFAARLACMAKVTTPAAMVVEIEVVPDPVTFPVKVMVWFAVR